MRRLLLFLPLVLLNFYCLYPQSRKFARYAEEDIEGVMSEAYWRIWNLDVQQKIDEDIDKHRKSTVVITLPDAVPITLVQVQQIAHEFIFGAHIFNYNQLGSNACNQQYKDLYGTLFNSATVPFYWKTFELEPGSLRFSGGYYDTEAYWNNEPNPKSQLYWRRPATDPVVEFCLDKKIRVHGHPLIWGNRKWQHPDWIFQNYLTPEEKERMDQLVTEYANTENRLDSESYSDAYNNMSTICLDAQFPHFAKSLKELFRKRIIEIANHYGGRIDSWDVVNESAVEPSKASILGSSGLMKSAYGIMPRDYAYQAFRTADEVFPNAVLLNINDYWTGPEYPAQVMNLQKRGCRIDLMGLQMHLFDPQQCLDIAAGKEIQTPRQVYEVMRRMARTGLPIHLSEVTITSPSLEENGQAIQAIIAQNLYRLWFSIKSIMGITWWNVVDDCGAPGEPSLSGMFTREMEPKLAYYALDNLINTEWKTNLTLVVDEHGQIEFRGFKGNYLIKYKDSNGDEQTIAYYLK